MLSRSNLFVVGSVVFLIILPTILGRSSLAQTSGKQVTIEVAILRATPEVAKQIFADEPNDSFAENGTETVTTDTPSINDNSVTTATTTNYEAAVRPRLIEVEEYQQILKILKQSERCSVSVGPSNTTFGDGNVIGFVGTARTFCVSSEERRAKFGTIVSVPEFQVVEDGVVVEHHTKVAADGSIDLNSQIVINKIVDINNFTFDGATKPVTLELPTIKTRLLNIDANMSQNHVLIVPSRFVDNTVEQRIAKGIPFASNVPYVDRLFKSVGVSRNSCLLYYAISVGR